MNRRAVNLIPWRERQRHRCRRFWMAFFIFAGVAVLLVVPAMKAKASLGRQQAALWLQSEADVLNRITSREPHFRALREQWLKQQARVRQREATRSWHDRLNAFAERMPDSAWLTTLHFRQGQLELEGLTRSFAALSELEQALAMTQGFRLQPTGATERDEQGHWRFRYQLNKEAYGAPRP